MAALGTNQTRTVLTQFVSMTIVVPPKARRMDG